MRKIQGFCWHIQPIFFDQLPLHLEQALESGRGKINVKLFVRYTCVAYSNCLRVHGLRAAV